MLGAASQSQRKIEAFQRARTRSSAHACYAHLKNTPPCPAPQTPVVSLKGVDQCITKAPVDLVIHLSTACRGLLTRLVAPARVHPAPPLLALIPTWPFPRTPAHPPTPIQLIKSIDSWLKMCPPFDFNHQPQVIKQEAVRRQNSQVECRVERRSASLEVSPVSPPPPHQGPDLRTLTNQNHVNRSTKHHGPTRAGGRHHPLGAADRAAPRRHRALRRRRRRQGEPTRPAS